MRIAGSVPVSLVRPSTSQGTSFFFEQTQDLPGVFRLLGDQLLAVEKFQCVENGCRLPGAFLAGDRPQSVRGGQVPVLCRDEDRETGIIRRLIPEMTLQADACDGFDQVPEVNGLVWGDAGQLPDGLPLGPFRRRPRP